jgi:phytoene desaturase
VLEGLFTTAGRHIEDYIALTYVDPLTRYFYPDGAVLDISHNLAETVASIAALDRQDADGYLRFLAYAARMFRITAPVAIYDDPPTLRDILGVPVREMLQVDALRSMDAAICAHVRSPYLRKLLRRFATYLGASPYQARAIYNVIAHAELTAGLSYVRGGTYSIARAYQRLAEELGVEIRTDTPAVRILTEGGRASGVELASGAVMADAVIANVDVFTTYRELLPPTVAMPSRFARMGLSCSGFVMLLGIEGQHPQLAHHNIFFSTDYRREFGAIFEQSVPPPEPTVYVAITSKSDPDHAPEGCENWYVMVNTPPVGPQWDWAQQAGAYRDLVLARLASHGLDVRGRIRAETILAPPDLALMTGAWRGALYGHSFNNPLAPFLRPRNRAPNLQRLYFAGGTTHPGGGVPMVTLSGGVAAREALQDM